MALTGRLHEPERVAEDIELVCPTVVTCYVIKCYWGSQCLALKKPQMVTAALPRHHLELQMSSTNGI
jgi:hypothetical protein